jgi:hypothetical protein
MVGFAFISDFELGRVFIENHATDGIPKHYFSLNLIDESTFCLLWLVVRQTKSGVQVSVALSETIAPFYKH